MKKETIIGIVFGILIFIGGYFYLDNQERLMDEETRVGEPVKMDLPKTEKVESAEKEDKKYVEELAKFSNEHNKTRTQKKSSKKFKTLEDGTKHEIIPYTEKLPPMPDEEENNSTLFGVDSNNNGVRDDLEILTVQLFGEDRDVVEAEFAAIKARSKADMISDKAIKAKKPISDEDMKIIIDDMDKYVTCLSFYGGTEAVKKSTEKVYWKQYNTYYRERVEQYVRGSLRGGGGSSYEYSEKACRKFFEETKHYEYFN